MAKPADKQPGPVAAGPMAARKKHAKLIDVNLLPKGGWLGNIRLRVFG